MNQSLQIARFAGIPVKVHWTFSLLLLFVFGMGLHQGMGPLELSAFMGFVLILFLCVILHEYGHALMAKRYGVKTLDIIISPIGGVARLEKLPKKPIQELWVAIAGPLVNIAIAIVLLLILLLTFDLSEVIIESELDAFTSPAGFLASVVITNMMLFFFNLIPAFPMDGGRILRALLAMRFNRVKATDIASKIGKGFAIVFVGLAFFPELEINQYLNNYVLLFIGIFIFIMANRESQMVHTASILKKGIALDIMNTKFTRVHLSEPITDLLRNYVAGGEKNYLVFDSMGNISGVIPELFLKDAYKEQNDGTAAEILSKNWLVAGPCISLEELFHRMNEKGVALAVIKNGDQIQGVVDRHMLQIYMQLNLYDR